MDSLKHVMLWSAVGAVVSILIADILSIYWPPEDRIDGFGLSNAFELLGVVLCFTFGISFVYAAASILWDRLM